MEVSCRYCSVKTSPVLVRAGSMIGHVGRHLDLVLELHRGQSQGHDRGAIELHSGGGRCRRVADKLGVNV